MKEILGYGLVIFGTIIALNIGGFRK